jgi:hypothetical protein
VLLPRRCDIQLDTWLVASKLFDKSAPGTALRNAYGFDARQVVALGGAHQHRAGETLAIDQDMPWHGPPEHRRDA